MKIGGIGLGPMGSGKATNILKAGREQPELYEAIRSRVER